MKLEVLDCLKQAIATAILCLNIVFLSLPIVSGISDPNMAQYNNTVLSLTTVTTPDPYVTYSAATRQFYLVSYSQDSLAKLPPHISNNIRRSPPVTE